jgi:hypothetical protein
MLHWRGNLSAHVVCVCREKQAPGWKNYEEMRYNVLQKMRRWTLYRAAFRSVSLKTELLEVEVTI